MHKKADNSNHEQLWDPVETETSQAKIQLQRDIEEASPERSCPNYHFPHQVKMAANQLFRPPIPQNLLRPLLEAPEQPAELWQQP